MLEDVASRNKLGNKISMLEDPDDLVAIFDKDKSFANEIAVKLISLKRFNHFVDFWMEKVVDDMSLLLPMLPIINEFALELCEEAKLSDFFIRSLFDIATSIGDTFEAFKVCMSISELVIHNKMFPSKAIAILYFQKLSALFKASGNALSYLNALHVLNELEPRKISSGEFEHLKVHATFSSNVFAKEVFCGIKCRLPEQISITVDDSTFSCDEELQRITSLVKEGAAIDNNYTNAAILLKYSFPFNIDDGVLKVSTSKKESFTSRIFKTIGYFESKKKEVKSTETKDQVQNDSKQIQKVAAKNTEAVSHHKISVQQKTKIEFKNRFSNQYKKSKLIRIYMRAPFEDGDFEERAKRREEDYQQQKREKELERSGLEAYKDVVQELRSELEIKIQEKAEKDRKILLEREKEEQERLREERNSKMWRNNILNNQPNSVLENKSVTNIPPSSDAENSEFYVPKISTLNFSDSDLSKTVSNIYQPPHLVKKDFKDKKLDKTPKTDKTPNNAPWRP
ncbi:hypothetical protein GINT2_000602 [Glugoides intestinalis]